MNDDDYYTRQLWNLCTVEELAIILDKGSVRDVPQHLPDRRRRIEEARVRLRAVRGEQGGPALLVANLANAVFDTIRLTPSFTETRDVHRAIAEILFPNPDSRS